VPAVDCRELRQFALDHAMDSTDPSDPSFVSQEKCYRLMCQWMLDYILEGFHCALFCYGQTGTGKTTTIMGNNNKKEERGILTRLLADYFEKAGKLREEGYEVQTEVQMLEIYNERIKDLLVGASEHDHEHGKKSQSSWLQVRVHPKCGVYVVGLSKEVVEDVGTCVKLIDYGNAMKSVSATAMNSKSSRAHTIFKMNLKRRGGQDHKVITSETVFVDLAGRENEKTTKCTDQRMVELTFINCSLMHLSHCIQNLRHGQGQNSLAMFRNSKLTLLLANALSGNSKTAMIGTLVLL
jgi:hypothetical protein